MRKQQEAEHVQKLAKETVAESVQKQGKQEAQDNKVAKDLKPLAEGGVARMKPYVLGNKVGEKQR